MDRADWLVLCALNMAALGGINHAIDMVADCTQREPELITHPSMIWWAQKYKTEVVTYYNSGGLSARERGKWRLE